MESKNDTTVADNDITVADVDVLKNDTTVDDVELHPPRSDDEDEPLLAISKRYWFHVTLMITATVCVLEEGFTGLSFYHRHSQNQKQHLQQVVTANGLFILGSSTVRH
ncbi:hypothetical protein Tco_0336299 [Tanacetum coccineum]